MSSQTILQLIDADRVAARDQGYALVVSQYARRPIPADVLEALVKRFAEGPPWADGLISALACGEQRLQMPTLLCILEEGTADQQRRVIAELWHRHPAGPADALHALLWRAAQGAGLLAFDAANVLASSGDHGPPGAREATDRLVELIAAADGKPESLRHHALETLSPELQASVDEGLRARGLEAL